MLIWQSNLPRFVIDEHVGDTISLYFGITNIDDIELEVFCFIAKLVKHEDRWSLDAQLRQIITDPRVPEPQMNTLTSKLQLAIETGKDFDFREYFENWTKGYGDFSILITDTALPHAVPTRILLRQYPQDNYNKVIGNRSSKNEYMLPNTACTRTPQNPMRAGFSALKWLYSRIRGLLHFVGRSRPSSHR